MMVGKRQPSTVVKSRMRRRSRSVSHGASRDSSSAPTAAAPTPRRCRGNSIGRACRIAQRRRIAQLFRMLALAVMIRGRQRRVDIEHHLRAGVDALDLADEAKRLLGFALGILGRREHERELRHHAVAPAHFHGLERLVGSGALADVVQHRVAGRLRADVGHAQPARAHQPPASAERFTSASERAKHHHGSW